MRLFVISVITSILQINAQAEVPTWVIGLRSGKEAMVIDRGSEFYFRRQLRDSDLSENELCEEAEKMAFSDIEKVYPNASTIPYRLEVKFYDEDLDECSVTIAIDKSIKRLNSDLEKLKKENEAEKAKLSSELKRIQEEKNRANEEKRALEQRLEQNKELSFYVQKVESAGQAFGNKVAQEGHRAEEFAFTGTSYRDFMDAIGVRREIQRLNAKACNNGPFSGHTTHGNIEVCWSSWSKYDATIVGFCNTKNKRCYRRDP